MAPNFSYFGVYRISSRLATGGMAEVYLGRRISADGTLGPIVAIKRLLPHLAKEPSIVRMFLNEARITCQVVHPNVVRVLDLGQAGTEPYIAMELLEGHTFADLRAKAAEAGQHVPISITLRVLTEACRGLDAAHRAKDERGDPLAIVHRDFTPDNIHIGFDGSVKVIDFGIAKSTTLGNSTEPGTLKGKFFYMSPEMIAGLPVDHRADLFAAGVMLYEQLCGRRPFTGNTAEGVLSRIAEGKPRPPREFDPSVPVALELICLTALAKNPNARFPGLGDFIHAIENVGGTANVGSRVELASYIGRLFPPQADPKLQTLVQAREADPSYPALPGLNRPPPPPGDALAPAQEVLPPEFAPPRARPPSRAPSRPLPSAGRVRLEALLATLSRKRNALLLAAGVLLLAGAAAWLIQGWQGTPQPAPEALLVQAQAEPEAEGRARLLHGLAHNPRATAAQLERAGALLEAVGASEAMLALADGFRERFPEDPEAVILEARACIGLRRGKRAEAAIARAGALLPRDPRPDLLAADLRQMQGDVPGALEALGRASQKKPDAREVLWRQGYLYSQSGRLEEAGGALSVLLQHDLDPRAASELAFVRFRQKRNAEALALLRRALHKAPSLAAAHYYLGAVLYSQGDVAGAARAYRDADRLGPEDPRPLTALCQLQSKGGTVQETDATRKLLASRFPDQAQKLAAQCLP